MRWPWSRSGKAEELDEEMRNHLEMAGRERLERGKSPAAAAAGARREVGNVLMVAEVTRELWGWASLERFAQDLRYGARLLLRSPGFTTVAVLTLALGISANTALFSVVNGVLLSAPPFPHPEQLLAAFESKPHFEKGSFSYPNFLDLRDQNHTLAAIAAYRETGFTLTGSGQPELLRAQMVSADLFSMLGIQAVAGRTFAAAEDRLGATRVALLSTELWKRKFGASVQMLGSAITLDGASYVVVGVVPGDLQLYIQNFRGNNDVYVLMGQYADPHFRNRKASWGTDAVARLKPGVTLEQARADLNGIARALGAAYPDDNKGIGVTLAPLQQEMVGKVRPLLLILLGAVGFVLLIACGNVASLLLARSTVRGREVAIRAALGASPLRVLRQLLTESLLLSSVGGALGLIIAALGTRLALQALPASLPRAAQISVDARVLGYTLLISLFAGVVFGLAPALKAARPNLSVELSQAGRGLSGARHRAQAAFIVMETALALVLLAGAGLMVRTLLDIWNIDPGFNPHHAVLLGLGLPPGLAQGGAADIRSSLRQAEQAIAAVPGIQQAALSWGAMPMRGDSEDQFWLEGQPKPASANDMNWALTYVVQPAYFAAMQLPLRRGRLLQATDNERAAPVAVVDEHLAQRYFRGGNALGKHVHLYNFGKAVEIVGVVGHVRQFGLDTDAQNSLQAQIYLPIMQVPDDQFAATTQTDLVVRTALPALVAEDAIHRAVQQVNGDYVVFGAESMDEVIAAHLAPRRFSMILLAVFAGVALLLAAIGIYGVLSYVVAQRRHEIGVRMALGARRSQVVRLVLGQGALMLAAGVAFGVAGALGLTRLMIGLLYGVAPADPLTFAAAVGLLCAIALAACWIPASRAARVDPLIALRDE